MAGGEWQIVALHHVRVFVRLHTDAVPGAVHEELRQSFLCQNVAGGGIHPFGGSAGANRLKRRTLGALQHRILLCHIWSGLTDAVGAG